MVVLPRTYPRVYPTVTGCTCTEEAPTTRCSKPFCDDRRCGVCHICRFVGTEERRALTMDQKRLVDLYTDSTHPWPWWDEATDKGWVDDGRWTAEATRLIFDGLEIIG